MMDFNKFKKMFDESFGKVTPDEFIQRMKKLGYEFKDKSLPKRNAKISIYRKGDDSQWHKDGNIYSTNDDIL